MGVEKIENMLAFWNFTVFIRLTRRPGRLLNFWTLRVGAYSRWALIRGWALHRINTVSKTKVPKKIAPKTTLVLSSIVSNLCFALE